MEINMDYFSAFESIIMTAANLTGDPTPEPATDAELAARYAARVGWEDAYAGCSTNRRTGLTISGGDGELTIATRISSWTIPVADPSDVLDALALHRILPAIFSTGADATLDDIADAYKRVSARVLDAAYDDEPLQAIGRTWQGAADFTRDYRLMRLRELAHGIDVAV